MLNKKKILITGGTGSFGKKALEIITKKYKLKKCIIFSRDEQKQFSLQQKFPDGPNSSVRYFLGDVRDFDRVNYALKGIDYVIHAAALKHVPMAEYNPLEVIKTNILGAENIIRAAINNNVKKVLALSTDKASSPINLYGATKLVSDKLFVAANNYKGVTETKFSVVRYGNVMGSRGSVIPYFLKKKKDNLIPVTDTRMTRFNITLKESVNFVIKSLNLMWGGEIFVPKIPSYKILDLVKSINSNAKIKIIGIRPGEKIDEEMISAQESLNTIESKNFYIITPNLKDKDFKKEYLKKNKYFKACKEEFIYSSKNNSNFLSVSQLVKLIKFNQQDFD